MGEESVTVRVEGKSSSSSWVVDMEKMLEQANPSMEMVLWKQRSIRRVPEFIKELIDKHQVLSATFRIAGPFTPWRETPPSHGAA